MPKNINTPIPETTDIDLAGLVCFQFSVPDTLRWRRVAFGLVSLLSKGRYWLKSSGNIRDVQQIGFDVLDTFKECDTLLSQEQINQIIDELCQRCGVCMQKNCCCPQCMTPTDVVNVTEPVVDYPIDLTGETQGDDSWFEWKCKASDYTIDVLIDVAMQTAAYVPGDEPVLNEYGELVFRILRNIFPDNDGASSWVSDLWWAFVGFSTLIIEATTAEVASNIASYLETNRTTLKNLIFCQPNPLSQKQAFKDHVMTAGIPVLNRWIFNTFLDLFAFQFMWIEESLRSDLPAFAIIQGKESMCNCNLAGNFDLPFGWITVPLIVNEPASSSLNTGIGTFLQNEWQIDGIPPTGDNAGYDINVFLPSYTDMTLVPNNDIGGFIIVVDVALITGDDGLGLGKQNALPVQGFSPTGDFFPFGAGDIFAGARADDTELQAWLLESSFTFRAFDSDMHNAKTFIRFVMFGGDNTTNFQLDLTVYAVVREQA